MEKKEGLETKESLCAHIEELKERIRELEHENEELKKKVAAFNEDRQHMRQMQARGIAEARQAGVRFGRPALEIPEKFPEIAELYRKGEITARAASDVLGVSSNTFRKWLKNEEDKKTKKNRKSTQRKSGN